MGKRAIDKLTSTKLTKKYLYRNVLLLNKKYEHEYNENFKKFLIDEVFKIKSSK